MGFFVSHDFMPVPLNLSMTSREIAELTGKRHDHVIRDIRAMLAQVYDLTDNPNLGYQQIQGVIVETDSQTKRTAAIHLDKDHTLTLLTGYDAKARHRVIKRWQELETQAKPAFPDFTNPAEAARAWALEYEARQAAQHALIEAQPKIVFYDQVTHDSDTLVDWAQAFSLLKRRTGQTFTTRTFLDFLRRHGVACQPNLYANIGRDRFKPRKDYINTWFVSELTPTGGVEWMMRPYAISEVVRLIEKERTSAAMVAGYLAASG
jgi:phage regulator Rha-like protein